MSSVDTEPGERCPHCGHWSFNHFKAEDSLGKWEFCLVSDCECFLDFQKDED